MVIILFRMAGCRFRMVDGLTVIVRLSSASAGAEGCQAELGKNLKTYLSSQLKIFQSNLLLLQVQFGFDVKYKFSQLHYLQINQKSYQQILISYPDNILASCQEQKSMCEVSCLQVVTLHYKLHTYNCFILHLYLPVEKIHIFKLISCKPSLVSVMAYSAYLSSYVDNLHRSERIK